MAKHVTRQTARSVTPRRDARRSVTPTRRGRAGRGPLGNLEEETFQEVEEFEEHLLNSFEATLLHNIRWWFYPCKQGGMPPFKYDGAIDQWRKTVVAFSGDRVYIMQRDDPMASPIPRLTSYEDVEVMVVARKSLGARKAGEPPL